MQTVSSDFTAQINAGMRKLKSRLLISFQKTFASGITFFTIGTSTIGGSDIIKGEGSVVQEWDKYAYTDYSDRLISWEVTREIEQPIGSLVMSMADAELANYDDLFTPNADATIGAYIRPNRPFKLFGGFKEEAIPLFSGLTEKMPKISTGGKKTAKFHAIDFIRLFFDKSLDQTVMQQNKRTDEVIATLLQAAGLTSSQYSLDAGITVIPFVYFEKGKNIGNALKELVEAEMGSLYQDEQGVIRFENRQHYTTAPHTTSQFSFSPANCYEIDVPSHSNVINVVEIESQVREVQAKQKLWESSGTIEIPANGTVEIFADFNDDFGALPVTTVDTPVNVATATTSSYASNTAEDGSGSDAASYVSVSSVSLFSTSYKMTFANNHSAAVYLTNVSLYATPAKVTQEIYLREEDSASVDEYEEHVHSIKNNFIQSETWAYSFARILLAARSNPETVREITIPAAPHLQLGDLVTLDDGSATNTYHIVKKVDIMNDKGYANRLTLIKRTIETYFRIGISTIGGSDKIAP